jgi:hypothetical protein
MFCRLAEELCKGRDCPWLVLASTSIRGRKAHPDLLDQPAFHVLDIKR